MSATRPGQLLRRLAPPDPDDGPLLARFATDRDSAAFAALVRRHGPVVLAVCRRVTGHPQDAEDAFQAVFLVLAKKAGQLRDPGRLGNWLYGVAVRVAGRARRAAARRRVREVQAVDPPDPAAPDTAPPADIGPALHEELAALPGHYREPIVLCDLQGATRSEAAKVLGVPEGTVSSRLANGRRKLAERLTRRGVALSAVGVPAAVAEGRAAVPESLVQHTCGVVAAWAAGAAVPAVIVRLAAGGFPVKSVLLCGVLTLSLVAGAVIAGGGPPPAPAAPPDPLPPLPPPAVAAAEEPQVPPAAPKGPKAKDAAARDKDQTVLVSPRLREAIDLPVRGGRRVVWHPTGAGLVVSSPEWAAGAPAMGGPGGPAGAQWNRGPGEALLLVEAREAGGPAVRGFATISTPQRFVGFTPDGRQLVLAQREAGLVSGKHRVAFVELRPAGVTGPVGGEGAGGPPPLAEGAGGPPGLAPSGGQSGGPGGPALSLHPKASFDIDPDQTDDFVFAPDGKSYTTLLLTRRDDLGVREAVVRRVSALTGQALDSPGSLTGAFRTVRLTADGKRLIYVQAHVANSIGSSSPGGDQAWSATAEVGQADGPGGEPLLVPSRDGSRVLFGRGVSKLVVLDGATGKALPGLERVGGQDGLVDSGQAQAAFSADGRLLAASYTLVEKKETRVTGADGRSVGGPKVSLNRGEQRLGVWDTTTGRLVRSWSGHVTALAFHPTRPVLAVVEPNGAQTRLGLWDFSAE